MNKPSPVHPNPLAEERWGLLNPADFGPEPPPNAAAQMILLRNARNALFKMTDMMAAMEGYPISADERAALLDWRQQLRDMTQHVDEQEPFATAVWPEAPAFLADHGVVLR